MISTITSLTNKSCSFHAIPKKWIVKSNQESHLGHVSAHQKGSGAERSKSKNAPNQLQTLVCLENYGNTTGVCLFVVMFSIQLPFGEVYQMCSPYWTHQHHAKDSPDNFPSAWEFSIAPIEIHRIKSIKQASKSQKSSPLSSLDLGLEAHPAISWFMVHGSSSVSLHIKT